MDNAVPEEFAVPRNLRGLAAAYIRLQGDIENLRACIAYLQAMRLTVIDAYVGDRNPRVIVEPSPLCGRLMGVTKVRAVKEGVATETRVAVRFRVQIEWTVTGIPVDRG